MKEKVSVLGLGYVGLPLLKAVAKVGKFEVAGYDKSSSRVADISKEFNTGFRVSNNEDVLKGSKYFIVCVPTPVFDDLTPDYSFVAGATKSIAKYLTHGSYVIIESTVNPGACEEVVLPILVSTGLKPGVAFELSHCPERINPGDNNWQVGNIPRVVGSLTEKGNKKVVEFYSNFVKAQIFPVSSIKAAEAAKILENSFRDVNIAFVNELAKSFSNFGIDIVEVINAASTKPFGFLAHYPGVGVGGHCIPVDPYYLIEQAKKVGFDHKLLRMARDVNRSMPHYGVGLLLKGLKEKWVNIKGSKIGVLGLSYKANVADFRESPAIEVIELLKEEGANVAVYDPFSANYKGKLEGVKFAESLEEVVKKSTGIILVTNHNDFANLRDLLPKASNLKVFVDGRNMFGKKDFNNFKVSYFGIGHM